MNKQMVRFLTAVLVTVFFIPSSAFAWGGKKHKEDKDWVSAHSAMMKMAMPHDLVASGDGGVIVLAGKKLYKYDANLNLVKEQVVPLEMDGMKKECPMMSTKKPCEKGEMSGKCGKCQKCEKCKKCHKPAGEEGDAPSVEDEAHAGHH